MHDTKRSCSNFCRKTLIAIQSDNINRMKSLLTSRNLAVDNRIRNYLKRYDNQVSVDLLDTLAILSANLIKNESPQESPDPVLWFGWHSEEGTA